MNRLAGFCILASAFLTACQQGHMASTLRIASDATFPPFHLVADDGNVTGFDIELAQALAVQAGLQPEVVVLPYDDLFSGLTDASHDVVAATTGITSERQQKYLFSEPYFATCQVAVVRTGEGEPAELSDLRQRRIGASDGGTSASAMRSIDGKHVTIESGQGTAMLLSAEIDAWVVDEFDGVAAARGSGGRLAVLQQAVASEHYGFVFALGQTEIRNRFDQALRQLRQDGTLGRLQEQFGLARGPGWPVTCSNRP